MMTNSHVVYLTVPLRSRKIAYGKLYFTVLVRPVNWMLFQHHCFFLNACMKFCLYWPMLWTIWLTDVNLHQSSKQLSWSHYWKTLLDSKRIWKSIDLFAIFLLRSEVLEKVVLTQLLQHIHDCIHLPSDFQLAFRPYHSTEKGTAMYAYDLRPPVTLLDKLTRRLSFVRKWMVLKRTFVGCSWTLQVADNS